MTEPGRVVVGPELRLAHEPLVAALALGLLDERARASVGQFQTANRF